MISGVNTSVLNEVLIMYNTHPKWAKLPTTGDSPTVYGHTVNLYNKEKLVVYGGEGPYDKKIGRDISPYIRFLDL